MRLELGAEAFGEVMEELYEVLGVSDVADKDEVGNDDVKIIDNG